MNESICYVVYVCPLLSCVPVKKTMKGLQKAESFILKSYFWQGLSVFYEKFDCLKNIWCRVTLSPRHHLSTSQSMSGQTRPSYLGYTVVLRNKYIRLCLSFYKVDRECWKSDVWVLSDCSLAQTPWALVRAKKESSQRACPRVNCLQRTQAPRLTRLVSTCPVSSLSPVLAVNLREAKNLKNWHTQTISKNVWK